MVRTVMLKDDSFFIFNRKSYSDSTQLIEDLKEKDILDF